MLGDAELIKHPEQKWVINRNRYDAEWDPFRRDRFNRVDDAGNWRDIAERSPHDRLRPLVDHHGRFIEAKLVQHQIDRLLGGRLMTVVVNRLAEPAVRCVRLVNEHLIRRDAITLRPPTKVRTHEIVHFNVKPHVGAGDRIMKIEGDRRFSHRQQAPRPAEYTSYEAYAALT